MGANEKYAATYHGGEYVPDTESVRMTYCLRNEHLGISRNCAEENFTRWLETVRAEAKAEALRDLAGTGLESKKISKFQAAWIRGLAREYTQGPHKIVGAFATPETNKENTP